MSAMRAAARGVAHACRSGMPRQPFTNTRTCGPAAAAAAARCFAQQRRFFEMGGKRANVLRGEKNKSTPWGILGVTRDSDDKEVKKAYIAMAKKFHPDRNGGDDTQFKKVKEAYDLIKSGEAKRMYGSSAGPSPGSGPTGAGAGGNSANWARGYGGFAGQGPTEDMQYSSSYTSYDRTGGEQTTYTYRDASGQTYTYTEVKHGGDQNFWGSFQSAHQEALNQEAERMRARAQENKEFEELFNKWAAHKINETADYRAYVKQRDEALYRMLVAWLCMFLFLRIMINIFA